VSISRSAISLAAIAVIDPRSEAFLQLSVRLGLASCPHWPIDAHVACVEVPADYAVCNECIVEYERGLFATLRNASLKYQPRFFRTTPLEN